MTQRLPKYLHKIPGRKGGAGLASERGKIYNYWIISPFFEAVPDFNYILETIISNYYKL